MWLYIQEALHTPNRINPKINTTGHISAKLLKTKVKTQIFTYLEKTDIISPNEHQKNWWLIFQQKPWKSENDRLTF